MVAVSFFGTTLHAQTVRDSAGIQVVENARSLGEIRMGATPTLVIGTQAGDAYLFSRVAGAVRLADGTIVVANGGSLQLRYFDKTGKYLRGVGQRGSGPGAFTKLDMLVKLPGDTLAAGALDQRHSYFTASGNFVRDGAARTSGMPLVAIFSDHTVLAPVFTRPEAKGRAKWVESTTIVAVDRTGKRSKALGRFPFMEMIAKDGQPDLLNFAPVGVFAAGESHFFTGFGDQYSIRVLDREGKLIRIIRRAWTPERVMAADVTRYVDAWARRSLKPGDPDAARKRQAVRDARYAETVPAFVEFRVDARGRLWVRAANLADAPACGGCLHEGMSGVSTWSVFDSNGRWVSDVRMPPRFHPRDIGADYILGVQLDDDDVPTIAMYRLF